MRFLWAKKTPTSRRVERNKKKKLLPPKLFSTEQRKKSKFIRCVECLAVDAGCRCSLFWQSAYTIILCAPNGCWWLCQRTMLEADETLTPSFLSQKIKWYNMEIFTFSYCIHISLATGTNFVSIHVKALTQFLFNSIYQFGVTCQHVSIQQFSTILNQSNVLA